MKTIEVLQRLLKDSPHLKRIDESMEVQLLPVSDERAAELEISVNSRYPVRIPQYKNGSPYNPHVEFPYTTLLVQRIGLTGRNWLDETLVWGGGDFDAVEGHAVGVGRGADVLAQVIDAAKRSKVFDVTRSKGGLGLHLFSKFRIALPCAERSQATHIMRAVLAYYGQQVDFPFLAHVNACGGNMWLWDATPGPNGFELLAEATESVPFDNEWFKLIPEKERSKPLITYGGESTKEFSPYNNDLIDKILNTGYICEKDTHNGRPIIRTHTYGLKLAHVENELPGTFETLSPGNDPQKPNCHGTPLPSGGFRICTYQHAAEHKSWQDSGDNVHCTYAVPLTLDAAVYKFDGGKRRAGGFTLPDFPAALDAAREMGIEINFPAIQSCEVIFQVEDGRLRVDLAQAKLPEDAMRAERWMLNGRFWTKKFGKLSKPTEADATDPDNIDETLRLVHTLDPDTGIPTPYAHYIKVNDGWHKLPKETCEQELAARGYSDRVQIAKIVSTARRKSRLIVNKPFQSAEATDTEWNLLGAQFRVTPTPSGRPLNYSHYRMVLDHNGKYFDPYVSGSEWCQRNGILTGGDYLMAWYAGRVQFPSIPSPILFLTGPHDAGKSSLYEMLHHCFAKGVRRVEKVFERESTFSKELDGAIFAVLDETYKFKNPDKAYKDFKDISFARQLAIEGKGVDSIDKDNQLGLLWFSNCELAPPILDADDDRFLCGRTEKPEKLIPKIEMVAAWETEAADFARALLDYTLPPKEAWHSRTILPVFQTELRELIIRHYQSVENSATQAERIYRMKAAELCGVLKLVARDYAIDETPADDLWGLVKDVAPEWSRNTLAHCLPFACEILSREGWQADAAKDTHDKRFLYTIRPH
jgi:hypothetical protein